MADKVAANRALSKRAEIHHEGHEATRRTRILIRNPGNQELLDGINGIPIQVGAVHRNRPRAIEVNRPYVFATNSHQQPVLEN